MRPTRKRTGLELALALVVAAAAASPAAAEETRARRPTPWDRGQVSLGIVLTNQGAFNNRYFVVGGSVGYYVADGLELSLLGSKWFGDEPSVARVSPQVRYVAVGVPTRFKPYVGGFYNRWFIGDPVDDDVDSVGARAGVVFHQGGGFVIGGGVAVERILSDCDDDCTDIYPDVIIAVTF